MDGMTPTELRSACERAGLRYYSTPGPHWKVKGNHTALRPDDPWLLSYVASLLVAEVSDTRDGYADQLTYDTGEDLCGDLLVVTDQQRIRAAMAVLGEG